MAAARSSDGGNTPPTRRAPAALNTEGEDPGEDRSFSRWCYKPKVSDSQQVKDICKFGTRKDFPNVHIISGFKVLIGDGNLFLIGEEITVNFTDMCVSLPLGMRDQLEIESETLAGHTIRYVVLEPGNSQGLSLSGCVVMLSAVDGEVINIYLQFLDVVEAVNAVNAIRRLIYVSSGHDNCLLQTLRPYLFSRVFVTSKLADRVLHRSMYILLDEQSMMLFDVTAGFASRPVVRFTFHDNDVRSPTITRSAFVDGCLLITAQDVSLLLQPVADTEESKVIMDKVCHLVLYVIKTKACDVFSATPEGRRPNGWQEHVSRLLQPEFDWDLGRMAWDVKHALAKSPAVDSLLFGGDTERPSTSAAANVREDVWGKKDLTDIFTKPKAISKHSDEMQAMWVVAEDEMSSILEDGLVPSSSIKSVGLDENSFEHFERCVDEIQEALLSQRYDQALSHIRGLQQIFRESKVLKLCEVAKLHELEIARCIFLAVQ